MSWEDIEDEEERFNAWDHSIDDEPFVEHNGVSVYGVIDQGCLMEFWYGAGAEEFDIRDLAGRVEMSCDDDHKMVIKALIEAGILTEDGVEAADER